MVERRIVTRHSLGWPAMTSTTVPRAPTNVGLVLHWDGPGRRLTQREHAECIRYWRSTRAFHMDTRGWKDIGYSYGVCPHGWEFQGRTYGYEQAAQPGGNSTWASCTLMLGEGEQPTADQINGVIALRNTLLRRGMGQRVAPHSSFASTDCPGDVVRARILDKTFEGEPVDRDEMYKAIMRNDRVKVPWGSTENPVWMMESVIVNIGQVVRDIHLKLDAYIATTERYIAAVGEAKAAETMPEIRRKADEQMALWEGKDDG